MLKAVMSKNDNQAKWLIGIFSFVVFSAVVFLSKFKFTFHLPFDVHIFATINAFLNTLTAILLVAALLAIKVSRSYEFHKNLMMTCLLFSVLFLVSYIAHHLFAVEAKFGDLNHDGVLSADEKLKVGDLRTFYLIILSTHIFLATIILPFILFTAYRALTGEYPIHKKLAKITWPLWFYVAATGPIIYFLIRPYYV